MMALNIYDTFYGRVGYEGVGQAKAVIFFIIVVAIGMIQLYATKSKGGTAIMKNKTSGIFATIFFTLISILFVSPILIVLMNSFKKKAFHQFRAI